MLAFGFWFCVSVVIYIYMGYPLLLWVFAKLVNDVPKRQEYLPTVSILIAAYNEEEHIFDTLQNKIEQDYPKELLEILVVSDESSDNTDEIVMAFARNNDVPVRLIRQTPRSGKTAGLNRLVEEAEGEIIAFSDANSIWESSALKKICSNFADQRVGYVTGKMVYITPGGSMNGDGCNTYMKYENWLRKKETAVSSIVGVDGGIDAMRASMHSKLNPDQLPDFVQPLKVVEQGGRVVYEPDALLKEEALGEGVSEYKMRVRVSLRALWAMYDMRQLFNPIKFGVFSWQLFSHKLLRYLAFLPLLGILVLNIPLAFQAAEYMILLLGQLVFYALAYMGMLNVKMPSLLRLPYYFSLLNVASAVACLRFIKKEKQVVWTPRQG
jgi:glycosyltransferase involved in cell wall biosynthesis